MRLRVLCPAKVNPFLSVGPPDGSGYHPIRTIYWTVGLFDELVVEPSARLEVVSDWQDLPRENTLTRALRYALELVSVPPLRICLHKRIPAQSGLGGGSSDAAGLIRALRRVSNGHLSERDAGEIARAVGKDVPFFLVGGAARGEGYGDVVSPLPDELRRWLVLAKPRIGCDTASAYARLDAMEREWRPFPRGVEPHNDFQSVAPPESLTLLQRLRELGAGHALLCGSGSAVYGAFDRKHEAVHAAQALAQENPCWVEVAPTLTRAESLALSELN